MSMSTRIGLTVTDEMDKHLEALAEQQKRRKSDIIRLALEAYLETHGIKLEEQLEYGGWRGGTADKSEGE